MQKLDPAEVISVTPLGGWANSDGYTSPLIPYLTDPEKFIAGVTFFSPDSVCELKLAPGTDPGVDAGLLVRLFASSPTIFGPPNSGVVELLQGTTVLASREQQLTGTDAEYVLEVPPAAAELITDYADLRLRLICRGGQALLVFRCYQVWMELP